MTFSLSPSAAHEQVGGAVYLILRREPADAETHRALADLRRHAHGAEHGRLIDAAFVASGSCRSRDVGQALQKVRADLTLEVHVQGVGQALRRVSVENDAPAQA